MKEIKKQSKTHVEKAAETNCEAQTWFKKRDFSFHVETRSSNTRFPPPTKTIQTPLATLDVSLLPSLRVGSWVGWLVGEGVVTNMLQPG